MVAGQAVPKLTASFSGFVNGEGAASLTSQPELTTVATSGSSPGVYSINVSGAASPNYDINYVNGDITVTPSTVGGSGPAPTIVGESVVITRKHNKKGKPIGKPTVSGYTITFSTEMDQSALGNGANYVIDTKSIKTELTMIGRKKTRQKVTVLTPIGFTVSNFTSNSVTLAPAGRQAFKKGGQITVLHSGLDNTSGVFLSQDGILTISPNGKSIS